MKANANAREMTVSLIGVLMCIGEAEGEFGFGANSGRHCPVWFCSERDKEYVSKDEVSVGLCWSCLLNISQPDYCFDSYVSNVTSGYVKEHVSNCFKGFFSPSEIVWGGEVS